MGIEYLALVLNVYSAAIATIQLVLYVLLEMNKDN